MRIAWLAIVPLATVLSISSGCRRNVGPAARGEADRQIIPPIQGGQQSYANVVDRVAPSVVTIRSQRRVRAPRQFPFQLDPLFRDFFGAPAPSQQRDSVQLGLGSGVIVDTAGHCVTNHHVVDGAEEITVEFPNGRTYDAKLVGTDAPSDLAVLSISARDLKALDPGNSGGVNVGDIVLAIGNPLGVGQTVTMGIISAKGRSTGLSDGTFEDFLQTDAPINRGNSGGALVNTNGELIGINSQILSTSGGNIGIGFAIPSNMVRSVMDQLIRTGEVRRGHLGVGIQKVTPDLASALGMKEARGVAITSVSPGSPADQAGLRSGDVIVALDGEPVTEGNALRNRIAGSQPGTQVTLTIVRDGKERQLQAKLSEFRMPAEGGSQQRSERGATPTGRMGLGVRPLTDELASQLGLPRGTSGVLVASVEPDGAAAKAGIQPGDVIQEANRKPVRSASDLSAALAGAGTEPVLLLLNRGGQKLFTTARLEQHQ